MIGSFPFANGWPVPFAKREPARALLRRAGAYAGAGLLTAVLGPLGTWERMGLFARTAFWTAAIVAGWAQFTVTAWLFAPGRPARFRPTPAQFAAVTLLSSVPITLELEVLNHVLTGDGVAWGALPLGYAMSVLMGGIVYGLSLAIDRAPTGAPAPVAVAPRTGRVPIMPRLMERVPPPQRGTLLALQMEDHYLRVHTDAGSALILYRMADAVAELAGEGAGAGVDGMRVHRSWWAATAAVSSVERRDGRVVLRLRNDLLVPVARGSVAAVQARGWGAARKG